VRTTYEHNSAADRVHRGVTKTIVLRLMHAMDQVIGVMLVIVWIGLLTDKILFGPIERFLHRRWGTGLR